MSKQYRCKHGMLKGQCSICRKWDARAWTNDKNAGVDKADTGKSRETKS